ncbi:MAG: Rieske 2Fe-2S domain-containing protein [Burkholderiales bacterium]|nr:Rieske 2Fe-2S domain-containing protein [Burkholderiales bacterium]
MNFAADPDAVSSLVRHDQVHKDVYLSAELFALEQRALFAKTWNYLGHASQVPERGDFFTLDLAGEPILVLRDPAGQVRAFHNRCAHKGTRLLTAESGRISGPVVRCPYHAWSYRLDGGELAAFPLKEGYEHTRLGESEAGRGLAPLAGFHVYRDFIFGRISPQGVGFEEYFGEILEGIDLMVDRSPSGRLRIEGGVLRNTINCNWKLYLENINDSVHPVSTHASAVRAAQSVLKGLSADAPKPLAFEQILPFGQKYDFFEQSGGKVFPNGHSITGTRFSIHSGYGAMPGYEAALKAARGEDRARQILERSPQNTVLYPSLALKGSPQTIRVIRPVAVDRTVIEAWNFRTLDAPELLFDRALTYSRLVFSPMSVVAHDDIHLFEAQQSGLRSQAADWVSLHREHDARELEEPTRETSGTNELLIRNQHRAWALYMGAGQRGPA